MKGAHRDSVVCSYFSSAADLAGDEAAALQNDEMGCFEMSGWKYTNSEETQKKRRLIQKLLIKNSIVLYGASLLWFEATNQKYGPNQFEREGIIYRPTSIGCKEVLDLKGN